MQQFEPSQETTAPEPAPPPTGVEVELEEELAYALEVEPRRDVRGRTLDDALQHDRRVRARILRRAKQVTNGMEFCTATCRVAEGIMRGSWVPFQKFLSSLAPQTAEQAGLFVLGLCFCWSFMLGVAGMLLALGLGGSLLALTLWTIATLTRAALALYLRHLIPW